MNKYRWNIVLATILIVITGISLVWGDQFSDMVLTIWIVAVIPLTFLAGIQLLISKKKVSNLALFAICFAIFAEAAHLSLRIPFAVIAIMASIIFIAVRYLNKTRRIKIGREIGVVLFFIYILVVFHLTFAPFQFLAPYMHTLHMEWTPFKEVTAQYHRLPRLAMYFAVGNVLMTIPFGLLIPILFKRLRSFWKIVVIGLGFSFIIEMLQMLFTLRSAEVDDLIFNTFGAVIGYLAFAILKKVIKIRF